LDENHWNESLSDELPTEDFEVREDEPYEDEDVNALKLFDIDFDDLDITTVGIQSAATGAGAEGLEEEEEPEELDYGEETTYTDGSNNGSPQPTDENASGEIQDPSNLNEEDGNTSTAVTFAGEDNLNVGFRLPQTDEAADTYKMRFNITAIDIQGGQGQDDNFGFYLVNNDGDELTDRQVLEKGNVTYDFSPEEEQNISDNHDALNLIIDSEINNNAESDLEINFFELISMTS